MKITDFIVIAITCVGLSAQDSSNSSRQDQFAAKMKWQNIGPVNFGGRIVDIATDPANSSTIYVASATGGLWKSLNQGTSWKVVFDGEASVSIGDIAIAPSKPAVIYLGMGEANNQRSSHWGNGIYKSTDGGSKWQHAGLDGTDHIGRIVVHPTDPDIAYVAALGALYSANKERGLYRTTDGGDNWTCIKSLGEDVGFVDVVIDPNMPTTLYAASYERRRRAWDFDSGGPGSAIWKTTDGGDNWTKLTNGLPGGELGRIGLAIYPRNPDILYATIENINPVAATASRPPRDAAESSSNGDNSSSRDRNRGTSRPRSSTAGGEVYRSEDGGETWKKTSDKKIGGSPGYYYGQIRIDPNDDKTVYVLSVNVYSSTDAGKTWKSDFGRSLHVDHHSLWIDPKDSRHVLLGNDGGLGQSWDRGKSWDHHDDISIGQFYAVGVDMRDPYHVYGGTQDNGSWGIPVRATSSRGLTKADATKIAGGDGFYVCPDPLDHNIVYAESQFGALRRIDLSTGKSSQIKPKTPKGSARLRYNWMSPLVISSHNTSTIYFGSQHIHRSRNRGDKWEAISPDLSTNNAEKIKGNVPHCTITTIAESPRREGLLYAGTDDGKVWMTKDGGRDGWTDLTDRFEGLPEMPLWVSRVEASTSEADRFYVAFTGYREDIRKPFLFVTTDGGDTFKSIAGNLPDSPINVVREHPRNDDVLIVGNEAGIHISLDAGSNWSPLGSQLPTTPVHDALIHPRDPDLVIGTHGRGLWVLDIACLEKVSLSALAKPFHLLEPRDGHTVRRAFGQGYSGARGWSASGISSNAVFKYHLGKDSEDRVTVEVLDAAGNQLYSRNGSSRAGVHEVSWSPSSSRGRSQGSRQGDSSRSRGTSRPRASGPGQYLLKVSHGETVETRSFWVHAPSAQR